MRVAKAAKTTVIICGRAVVVFVALGVVALVSCASGCGVSS